MNKNRKKIKIGNDELFEKGNVDFIDELLSTDYLAHAVRKSL